MMICVVSVDKLKKIIELACCGNSTAQIDR